MIKKFPKKAMWKWNRFNRLEKGFILYSVVLRLVILFTPILQLLEMNDWEPKTFFLLNPYMIKTDIVIIISMITLILWNTSFRFKRLINILIWFKENDALVNFILLWLISIQLLMLADTINLINNNFTVLIILHSWFYIIWWALIIWLIWNLFLALNSLKDKKSTKIVNIMQHTWNKISEEAQEIKGLFQ